MTAVTDSTVERNIWVQIGQSRIAGNLRLPQNASGIVLFAHGSGSGRFSPRNQAVAETLNRVGLGTLLIDLLEGFEAEDRRKVFDIALLADRLQAATTWLEVDRQTRGLPIGLFGASTGAAAALFAAACRPSAYFAVVSRGGRPDLVGDALPLITAPMLLIVGGYDEPVIRLNQDAFRRLRCLRGLTIIPGASHLFSEPGTLEEVARVATEWFHKYLTSPCHSASKRPEPYELGERFPRRDMDIEC